MANDTSLGARLKNDLLECHVVILVHFHPATAGLICQPQYK